MKRILLLAPLLLLLSILLCGCIAVVEETTTQRKVRSFIIPKEEVLYILEQGEGREPQQKRTFFVLERR